MENKKLNVFSLSSIQNFIKESKNAQELRNVSEFISAFMLNLMMEIKTKDCDIVYPNIKAVEKNDRKTGIGNTIVFISNENIEYKMNELIEKILKKLNISVLPVEIYTASVNYTNGNYKECYKSLMLELIIKKLNRAENLINGKDYKFSDKYKKFFDEKNFVQLKTDFGKILKYNKKDNGLSTVDIALGDYLFNKEKTRENLERITEFINKEYEKEYKKEISGKSEEKLREIIKKWEKREFLDELISGVIEYKNGEIKKQKIPIIEIKNIRDLDFDEIEFKKLIEYSKKSTSKYLAIYRLDIDNMGKKIGMLDLEEQKKSSEKVIDFMREVEGIVEEYTSYKDFIYAGGDDLLLLLPVEYCMKISTIIRRKFIEKFKDGYTYTQGIFVIGCKNDFSECIRNSVRLMEKAKYYGDGDKDYTVISVITEGYTSKEVYFKNQEYKCQNLM